MVLLLLFFVLLGMKWISFCLVLMFVQWRLWILVECWYVRQQRLINICIIGLVGVFLLLVVMVRVLWMVMKCFGWMQILCIFGFFILIFCIGLILMCFLCIVQEKNDCSYVFMVFCVFSLLFQLLVRNFLYVLMFISLMLKLVKVVCIILLWCFYLV